MMSSTIVEAFVKFKNQDYYINIAKTTDYRNLEKLEEEFNKRDDVDDLYFFDYQTNSKCKTIFSIYQRHHDALKETQSYEYYL